MPNEFVNPNLHVTLIHLPLALLVVGVLIEFFAFLGWRRSGFRAAGRWMILLGALALPPVLFSGLYAMADVNRLPDAPIGGDQMSWAEVRQSSPVETHAWEHMTTHGWSSAIGSVVILLAVVLWMGSSDLWRARLHLVHLLLIVGGLGVLLYGAWFGGEMVYRHAVGVEPPRGEPSEVATADKPKLTPEYFAPPLQTHVTLAGLTVSLGLAAMGLSLRAGAQRVFVEPPPGVADIGIALNPNARPATPTLSRDELHQMDDLARRAVIERPKPGRFWLLAALLGIFAAASGLWFMAISFQTWNLAELRAAITDTATYGPRRLAHVATGGGIIAMLLLLAIVARFAAGRRFVLSMLALLLIAAVGAQVWFGSLLLFDSTTGPLGSFNAGAATEMTTEEEKTEQPSTAPSPEPKPATTTTAPVALQ